MQAAHEFCNSCSECESVCQALTNHDQCKGFDSKTAQTACYNDTWGAFQQAASQMYDSNCGQRQLDDGAQSCMNLQTLSNGDQSTSMQAAHEFCNSCSECESV